MIKKVSEASRYASGQYFDERLAREAPELHALYTAKKISKAEALSKAGIRRQQDPLKTALRAWRKLDESQRLMFLALAGISGDQLDRPAHVRLNALFWSVTPDERIRYLHALIAQPDFRRALRHMIETYEAALDRSAIADVTH